MLLLLGLPAALQAQEDGALSLTLKQAQDLALENSQQVELARIELAKANAQVKEAMAALLPQVNGTLSYTQYGQLPSTIFPNFQASEVNNIYALIENQFAELGSPLPVPISQPADQIPDEAELQFGKKFNVNAEIMATQVVFNGVFLVGLQAASAFVSIVEHQEVLTREKLLDQVKRSYYQVLASQANVSVLEKNVGNLTKLLNETSALYENGFAEEIDVDRIQLSLNNLTMQLEQARRQVALTESVLKFQMGIDVYQPIALEGTLEDYVGEIDYNLPDKGDFNRRTEISLFNMRERVNEYNVKRYKAQYYPSLSAFASLGSSAQRDKFDFFRFTDAQNWFNMRYFGFQIDVPIWDSFGKKAQVQYAKLEIDRIRAEREQFFSGMDLEYETAKNSLAEARENLEFSRRNTELAEKIYNVTQIKYREGIGSSLEMTEAERDLYEAQANYLLAVYNLLLAKADIDKALGIYE